MNVIACDECNYEFDWESVNIQSATVVIDGQDFTLDYFACPKCSRIYRISLKDDRYRELQEDIEETKKRIRKYHGSGNVLMVSNLYSMAERKMVRLRNYSDKLNGKYPGTFVFAVSENGKDKTIKYLP